MHYGGNTTCLELRSKHFHPNMKFYLDAGGGLQPAGESAGSFTSDILRELDHAVVFGFITPLIILSDSFTSFPFINTTAFMFLVLKGHIGPKQAV